MHRDIKPDNVLIIKSENSDEQDITEMDIRLIDWGLGI